MVDNKQMVNINSMGLWMRLHGLVNVVATFQMIQITCCLHTEIFKPGSLKQSIFVDVPARL